ncbi:hypothetical protein DFH08DRAFT_1018225 [Mycena albidolilacea]|uniref:AB hydrolase-1 domain-containing protein n=1 Tax=Mycena albidolilacea TaxID=1033008 RepID=A0AAD6ZSS5_9AGAR|nr:hypothetical protein DFH08DRAFT_1018225 [Mycena albidolilacea]
MPTVSVPGKDIQFFFSDTGAPGTGDEYTTFILVHGHSYHSGTSSDTSAVFQKLLPLAAARSVRIICLNRREYPGSTPHTTEELRVYASGSDQERTALVNEAGVNLAFALDGIIEQGRLPPAVAVCGWSLGNTFVLAAMASISSLPPETQKRLQSSIKTIIMWDPPLQALGITKPPQSYLPLHDKELAPAERGPAFRKWVESYFVHGDLSTRDPAQLNFRHPDPSRKHTYADIPPAEMLDIFDPSVGDKCDTILSEPPFAGVLSAMVDKALFDPETRASWKGVKVSCFYAKEGPGNMHFGVWDLERRAEEAGGSTSITFRPPIEGANHFVMWEDPSLTLDELIACTKA